MQNDQIKEFKELIKIFFKQKSVKVSKNGTMEIVFRFKPNEMKASHNDVKKFTDLKLEQLNTITGIKYKNTSLQKQPSFCYNTYVRVINNSSQESKDSVKRFFKYFEKDEKTGNFIKKSYAEIKMIFVPKSTEEFTVLLQQLYK